MKQALGHLPSYSNAVVMLPLYPVAYQIQQEADVGEPLNVLLKKKFTQCTARPGGTTQFSDPDCVYVMYVSV